MSLKSALPAYALQDPEKGLLGLRDGKVRSSQCIVCAGLLHDGNERDNIAVKEGAIDRLLRRCGYNGAQRLSAKDRQIAELQARISVLETSEDASRIQKMAMEVEAADRSAIIVAHEVKLETCDEESTALKVEVERSHEESTALKVEVERSHEESTTLKVEVERSHEASTALKVEVERSHREVEALQVSLKNSYSRARDLGTRLECGAVLLKERTARLEEGAALRGFLEERIREMKEDMGEMKKKEEEYFVKQEGTMVDMEIMRMRVEEYFMTIIGQLASK